MLYLVQVVILQTGIVGGPALNEPLLERKQFLLVLEMLGGGDDEVAWVWEADGKPATRHRGG